MDSEPTILYMELVDGVDYLPVESNNGTVIAINSNLPADTKGKVLLEINRRFEIELEND